MPRQAKFPGKCKACGRAIHRGDTIYQDGAHWCVDESCANSPGRAETPEKAAPSRPQPERTPERTPERNGTPEKALARLDEFAAVHERAWSFAVARAAADMPDGDRRSRDIHAAVVYKAAIDYVNGA